MVFVWLGKRIRIKSIEKAWQATGKRLFAVVTLRIREQKWKIEATRKAKSVFSRWVRSTTLSPSICGLPTFWAF
jgi:hypothetical protein